MAIKEITKGTRFGRLTVTGEWETRKSGRSKIAFHKCICDCGNEVWVRGTGLRYGSTLSCGCYRTEQRVKIVKNTIFQIPDFTEYGMICEQDVIKSMMTIIQTMVVEESKCVLNGITRMTAFRIFTNGLWLMGIPMIYLSTE